MKYFTQEMLKKLQEANEEIKGSMSYYKFYMEIECRINGKWHFIGYGIPHSVGTIKTFKGKTYIMCEFSGDAERFTVKEKELIKI